MSKLEDQLVNMLRTAKEDTRNDISLEEKLGIKICTSEEDHIFVASSNPKKNYRTYTMKPLNLTKAIDFTIETEEEKQAKLDKERFEARIKTIESKLDKVLEILLKD